MNKYPYYQKKLLPHVDRRIRQAVFFRTLRDFFESYVFGRPTFAMGALVLAIMFIGAQDRYYEIEFQQYAYEAILESLAREQSARENAIAHVRMRVEEGKDKALAVAHIENLSLEETVNVPKRSEQVEYWHYRANVITVVSSEGSKEPPSLFMNLAEEEYVSVFANKSSHCLLYKEKAQCSLYQGISDEELQGRLAFDRVHDISSDYSEILSVHTKPFTFNAMEPTVFDRMEGKSIILATTPKGNIKKEYRFSRDGLALQSIHTFLRFDGAWYEMAIISFEYQEILPPEQFEEIFDVRKYPMERIETVDLS